MTRISFSIGSRGSATAAAACTANAGLVSRGIAVDEALRLLGSCDASRGAFGAAGGNELLDFRAEVVREILGEGLVEHRGFASRHDMTFGVWGRNVDNDPANGPLIARSSVSDIQGHFIFLSVRLLRGLCRVCDVLQFKLVYEIARGTVQGLGTILQTLHPKGLAMGQSEPASR
jgi:hypothetical protein